jgi:hypothetical protein
MTMKDRIIAAVVVFGGVAALGYASKQGVDKDVLLAATGLLVLVANALKPLFLPAAKPEVKP